MPELQDWLDEKHRFEYGWLAKRLSGNDTLANGTHQAGPYIPKTFLFAVFPDLNQPEVTNPDQRFSLRIDSHDGEQCVARAVWYNNKLHGRTRDETRLTNFGGRQSAMLDPENTGALCLFSFDQDESSATICSVWICQYLSEEITIESIVGPIEPGNILTGGRTQTSSQTALPVNLPGYRHQCRLSSDELPAEWIIEFPDPDSIIAKAMELRPSIDQTIDRRLLSRRNCEHDVFSSVEEAWLMERIKPGISSVQQFESLAQTLLQRRRMRSGRSLELQVRKVLEEEGFTEDQHFAYNQRSEGNKRLDFLFPSATVYRQPSFPRTRLRMLAVKTTLRDRWRQILNEAERIERKHLLTLQEGVSINQFDEMTQSNVQLVVPQPLFHKFHEQIRPELQNVASFLEEIRNL